jgi:predicted Zn finger-like uncharacterized protein
LGAHRRQKEESQLTFVDQRSNRTARFAYNRSMYTQCPECLTIFQVAPAALAQGRGSVTCGHCSAVFNALRTLTETLPDNFELLPAQNSTETLPQLSSAMMRPVSEPEPAPAASQRRPPADPTPEFARPQRAQSGAPLWVWVLGIVLLTPLLLAQIAYAERHALLGSNLARPWLERACASLGCHLPLPHDADGLVLLSRDVRPHPSVPKALIISATLRNGTDHVQAFPTVEITLADLDEHRIAMRRFRPTEYIGDARTIAAGLAPRASSALVFEVADPGKNAVAYEFKFL